MLPRAAPVIMRSKARKDEWSGLERGRKLCVERLRNGRLDFVLDGDVETRAGLILRDQEAAEVVRKLVAKAEQFGAVDAVGDASAEEHDVA